MANKTFGELVREQGEMVELAATYRMLAGFVRARYLDRDSGKATAQVATREGKAVSQPVLELVAQELEQRAGELEVGSQSLHMQPIHFGDTND